MVFHEKQSMNKYCNRKAKREGRFYVCLCELNFVGRLNRKALELLQKLKNDHSLAIK